MKNKVTLEELQLALVKAYVLAVLLVDRQAEHAEFFQPRHDPVRVDVRVVEFLGDRKHLGVHEVADGAQDVALEFGEPVGVGEPSHALILPAVRGARQPCRRRVPARRRCRRPPAGRAGSPSRAPRRSPAG